MFQGPRYANYALRFSLTIVFLWFGVSACMQPTYWANAWMPDVIRNAVATVGMSPGNFMILMGILEICIATSLATGFFSRWFSAAGAVILAGVMVFNGIDETLIRDVGLIGGLVALALWPERHYI